jgi:hypothetical protein
MQRRRRAVVAHIGGDAARAGELIQRLGLRELVDEAPTRQRVQEI